MGQTLYKCPSNNGPSSVQYECTVVNKLANGYPSPRIPLNPSACTRTIKLEHNRSSKYRLPILITAVVSLPPPLLIDTSSSCCACCIASITLFATSIILFASVDKVLILPLTNFLNCNRRFDTFGDVSNIDIVFRNVVTVDIISIARVICTILLRASNSANFVA